MSAKTEEPKADEAKADKEPAPAKTEEPKLVKARVLRDFWPTDKDEDRVRAGDVVEVTMESLIDGMEAGVLERVKK